MKNIVIKVSLFNPFFGQMAPLSGTKQVVQWDGEKWIRVKWVIDGGDGSWSQIHNGHYEKMTENDIIEQNKIDEEFRKRYLSEN